MPSLNDLKYASLATQTGLTGSLDDLETVWLLTETGASSGHINDLWFLLLEQQGYTTGSLGDRLFDWLVDLGYIGTLNDMLYQFWADGGVITPPPLNVVTHLTIPVRNVGEYVTNT